MANAKPFIKWVGGKAQLIGQINALLPEGFKQWKNATYIEPFIGGGAMLFHILRSFPNIKKAVINDINPDLTLCYKTIRDCPQELICLLETIQEEYYALASEEDRHEYYLGKRELYNTKQNDLLTNKALFMFLNRTCFNGLYRVNRSGKLNVPFGKSVSPTICDAETIQADSVILQKVEIQTGDYAATMAEATENTLFYFDPPYRPISSTSSFNSYTQDAFDDDAQA